MKFILISDVHRGVNNLRWPFTHTDVDAILVAGDIEHPAFLRQMGKKHPNSKIIAVLGNHDFYDKQWGPTTVQWWKDQVAERKNVTILEKEELIVGDVVFLGATLWARPKPQYHYEIMQQINDFKWIKKDDGKLTLEPVIEECRKSIAWLRAKLIEHAKRKVVVMTHFVPADFCVHEKYTNDPTTEYYSVSLDTDLAYNWPMPKVWCFGHTHMPFDMQTPVTRFVCNPYGYYLHATNPQFIQNLVIEV